MGATSLAEPVPGCLQIVEQRLCCFEIDGREPFGEPAINRLEKYLRIVGTTLIAEQPGKARGGAQFPGKRALAVCTIERRQIRLLGFHSCGGVTGFKNELASNA